MARRRSFDETTVVQAVERQFWDGGYAGTSLEDLMRVSGLGKGSLYAAFGDKHQLFMRVLRRYTDVSHENLRRALDEAPRAIDGLRLFLRAPIADGSGRGCLLANSTLELGASDAEVLEHAHSAYTATTTIVERCVERGRREGDIPTTCDPLELARALVAAQQGILFMSRTGLGPEALRATADTLVDQLLPSRRTRGGSA